MTLLERVPLVPAVVAIAVSKPSDPTVPAVRRTFKVGGKDAAGYALEQLCGRAHLHLLAIEVVALLRGVGERSVHWRDHGRTANACRWSTVMNVRCTVLRYGVHRLAWCVILFQRTMERTWDFSTRKLDPIARRAVEQSWTLHQSIKYATCTLCEV